MKDEILALMKQQLREIAERVTFDNHKQMLEETHRVFMIIESGETMMDTPIHPLVKPEPEIEQAIVEVAPTEALQELLQEEHQEEESHEINQHKTYRFERRIKGGVIPEIEAFVPEKIIYELGLQHGDLVRAKFLYKPANGGPARYEYEIAEPASEGSTPENIQEVNMGIVSYTPRHGAYTISRTVTSDEIIFEGEKLELIIPDEEADALDLREGDVVNAAFYKNNPNYMKVRWKYSTEELGGQSTPKQTSSYYKKLDAPEKEKPEQIFEGKTICVLGYEPGWTAFREEVEKRGGQINTLTGREGFDTVYGTINKSDCLIMFISYVGHNATIFSVDFCKKNNIPYTSLKVFGRNAFVKAAQELLTESKE